MGTFWLRLVRGSLMAVLGTSSLATQAKPVSTCSQQPHVLARHAGVYVQASLARAVYDTHRWDLGIAALVDWTPASAPVSPDDPLRDDLDAAGVMSATEIRISKRGVVTLSWRWHESAVLGQGLPHRCLVFEPDGSVRWKTAAALADGPFAQLHYVRVGNADVLGKPPDAPYFGMLFHGCHTDLHGVRWCFRANEIERERRRVRVRLKLDPSELPEGGSVLEVQGETLFWLMVPHGDGWLIYRSGWASEGPVPVPGKTVPWNVLTPDRTISQLTKG
jgi:hypothetical protein